MTARQKYGYVYGGTLTFGDQVRELDGMAWSWGRCDEVRLRAEAVKDASRTEGVPLAGIEIKAFWYSEIVTDDVPGATETAGADPFRPHGGPDDPDPFRPGSGHPCTGDI